MIEEYDLDFYLRLKENGHKINVSVFWQKIIVKDFAYFTIPYLLCEDS